MQPGFLPPTPNALDDYRVNLGGQRDIIWDPLYDFVTYAAAGQTSLNFFSFPIGQNGKTIADTNMELAGQLSKPESFLCTGIAVEFLPPALPGRATNAAGAVATNINDVREVMQSGSLQINIGNKYYSRQAPLGVYPQTYGVTGLAALAAAGEVADKMNIIDYGRVGGVPHNVLAFEIVSGQSFTCQMVWPTAVAITDNTRIGVRLLGFRWRSVQ